MYVDCLLYKLSWCQGLESWDEARCKQFLYLVVAKHVDSCAVAVFSVAVRRLAVTADGFSVSLFVSLPLFLGKYPVIFSFHIITCFIIYYACLLGLQFFFF